MGVVFALIMYRFCRSNVLYSASLSLECFHFFRLLLIHETFSIELLFWINPQPGIACKSVAYKKSIFLFGTH